MIALFQRHADLRRHFAGQGTPAEDRRLFAHVKQCERCRGEYRTLALLEELEAGGAERARNRLARGVFGPDGAHAGRSRVALGLGFAAAFACLAVFVSVGGKPASFQARGGLGGVEALGPSVAIYRVPRDAANPERLAVGETMRAGSTVHVGESLAFSYVNPATTGAGYLMIFARDDAGHVYWFWPAWNDAANDPVSLPVQASTAPVELTEAVRQPLQAGSLTLIGLFTPRPLHVREVEAAVADGLQGLQAFPGHLWTETLEVMP